MRSTRGAFFALTLLGGYLIWRNRFTIQRQLESMGVHTPNLGGEMDLGEKFKSAAAKISGRAQGAVENLDESTDIGHRRVGNL